MSASLDLFRDLVPNMASVSDALVEVQLEQAAMRHTAAGWGAMYTTAMVWYAAHLIATSPGYSSTFDTSSNPGPVASKSAGQLSVSYVQGASGRDAWLASTPYGRQYLEIRNTRSPWPFFVSGAVDLVESS